jgi:flagellar assembly factor FliW
MNDAIETARFGKIRYVDSDVIEIADGLPGFKALRHFLLIDNQEFQPIKFLQSIDDPIIAFPLIDPRLVRPDYHLVLSEEQQDELELGRSAEGLAYSIVTLGGHPDDASANLFAPLVINASKMRASQVILLGSEYSVSEPLLRG